MKNYLDKDDDTNFILKYKIVKNEIVVKLADNKTYKVPYTLENEENILKLMKKQAKKSKDCLDDIKDKMNSSEIKTESGSAIAILGTAAVCAGFSKTPLLLLIIYSSLISGVYHLKSYKANRKIVEDIEKNLLYLENEDLINNSRFGDKKITINSINNMRLKKLKQIIEKAKLDKKLNITSNNSSIQIINSQVNSSSSNNVNQTENISTLNNTESSNKNNSSIKQSINSNSSKIESLEQAKIIINSLSEENIALLRDLTNNNLNDPNILKYIKMSKEEQLEILSSRSQQSTDSNKPKVKVSLKKKR